MISGFFPKQFYPTLLNILSKTKLVREIESGLYTSIYEAFGNRFRLFSLMFSSLIRDGYRCCYAPRRCLELITNTCNSLLSLTMQAPGLYSYLNLQKLAYSLDLCTLFIFSIILWMIISYLTSYLIQVASFSVWHCKSVRSCLLLLYLLLF